MNLIDKKNIKIYIIYILFGFGGLWHVLDLLQKTMRVLAAPLIIAVSILLLFEVYKSIADQSRTRFLIWCCVVLFVGLGIEMLGVRTHFPFGRYQYSVGLKPQICGIPIAIGFAWLSITLSSLIIALKIIQHYQIKKSYHLYVFPVVTASFMLIFDYIMEHAAPKLDYWTWFNHTIPFQNYLSWFLLGVLFSFLWLILNIYKNINHTFSLHVYLSQLFYFILVLLKYIS